MSVGPEGAALELLVPQMVDVAQDGLEEQQCKQQQADDGMVLTKETNLRRSLLRQPDTETDCCSVDQVREDLE